MSRTARIEDLLRTLAENHGSDLHLQAGESPMGRVDGQLGRFEMPPLSAQEVMALAREVLGGDEKLACFAAARDWDTSVQFPGLGRYRVNLFYQRDLPGMVLRAVGTSVPTLEALGLPAVLGSIAAADDGLVLVTGATGSGKSTTLAAMVDRINATEACHIMTLEDPIEFVHANRMSLVNQREIALDSASFTTALRHVTRQDPDVILIGEMRDGESAATALTAAETGHLVLSTLHTQDAPESVERLVRMFPDARAAEIRMQLSLVLRAVVCQRLLPRRGGGRVAAVEVMTATPRIRQLVLEGDLLPLPEAIRSSRSDGMQTFNQALFDLVAAGTVEEADALRHSPNPDELRMNLQGIFPGAEPPG